MAKIGFIGTGNMGGALAIAVGKTDNTVCLCDPSRERTEQLKALIGNNAEIMTSEEICQKCDVVFLGVKPQKLADLSAEIKDTLAERKSAPCLVSMAAGVSTERIAALFGDKPIVRIMPNTPASVGKGMILYCTGGNISSDVKNEVLNSLKLAGELDEIDERLIDAASAISGCGPAFVYMFIDALADGGVRCGLPRDKAIKYAAQTLLGAAEMVKTSDKHPDKLKDEVCSPAGSTIEGVAALENGGFRSLAIEAVSASYERTKDLGKQ